MIDEVHVLNEGWLRFGVSLPNTIARKLSVHAIVSKFFFSVPFGFEGFFFLHDLQKKNKTLAPSYHFLKVKAPRLQRDFCMFDAGNAFCGLEGIALDVEGRKGTKTEKGTI